MNQEELQAIVKDVLGDDYLSLEIARFELNEDVRENTAVFRGVLRQADGAEVGKVEHKGVGLVDALFSGVKATLATEYPSLEHIHFASFSISADITANGGQASNSDALANAELTVLNTEGLSFRFIEKSRSVSASSVAVVLAAVEHFVNAERAVLRLYDWIQDAKDRGRVDLSDRYVGRLAELVKNSTYSESIERKRHTLGF